MGTSGQNGIRDMVQVDCNVANLLGNVLRVQHRRLAGLTVLSEDAFHGLERRFKIHDTSLTSPTMYRRSRPSRLGRLI